MKLATKVSIYKALEAAGARRRLSVFVNENSSDKAFMGYVTYRRTLFMEAMIDFLAEPKCAKPKRGTKARAQKTA